MELPPFRLERFFSRHELAAPHHLCASDCESWTVAELLGLEPDARRTLEELRLGYTEPNGHPELRAAIARQYERTGPDDVLVFCGGEEAIYALMQVAFEPGDRIAVHFPAYQSLHEVARGRGCEVLLWRVRAIDGWALDVNALWQRGWSRGAGGGRGLAGAVVNLPHNPTGYLMDRPDFEALVAQADARGVRLISDEVYRLLELRDDDRLPAACDLSETAVSLGVVSKSFGLPGLRIGWVATRDRRLLDRLAAFKDYLTICPPAPSELLAALALRHAEHLVGRNREILRRNLERLLPFMDRHGDRLQWVAPRGGPVAYPALRGGVGTHHFCTDVLEKAGVLLLPGSTFDPDDHRHVRLGYGRADFAEGLDALDAYLERS
jgi:aspartate/methionine/tyrosine aminotransferase